MAVSSCCPSTVQVICTQCPLSDASDITVVLGNNSQSLEDVSWCAISWMSKKTTCILLIVFLTWCTLSSLAVCSFYFKDCCCCLDSESSPQTQVLSLAMILDIKFRSFWDCWQRSIQTLTWCFSCSRVQNSHICTSQSACNCGAYDDKTTKLEILTHECYCLHLL